MFGLVDWVLGFGFGLFKGLLVVMVVFLFMILIFDFLNGDNVLWFKWMVELKIYFLLSVSGMVLVGVVEVGCC